MMKSNSVYAFPLVNQYLRIRMGVDFSTLEPGQVTVVESPRRLKRAKGYGYLRALWWISLLDGRSAVSVPRGVGETVRKILRDVGSLEAIHDTTFTEDLRAVTNQVLDRIGHKEVDRVFRDVSFACNSMLLRRHSQGDCRRLTDENLPAAEGLSLPTQCFPNGIAYGVVVDGMVVSIAFAHRHSIMEEQIADLGVETAPAYRQRGYAKTAVSAVIEHITRNGGEAYYVCRPDNHASIATAKSVGFVPYGKSLVLGAPRADSEP